MPRRNTKLSKNEIDKLFYQLCIALSGMKTPREASEFLRDLISYQEAEMIAKRLKIAELLLKGDTYEEVRESIGVAFGTIARVQEWLVVSGEGYRKAIFKTKNKKSDELNFSIEKEGLSSIKRRYPMYYWPELVLENIVKTMNKKEKEQLKSVIKEMDKMKQKTELFKQLKKFGF